VANTLEDLATLAALVYGVKTKRKDNARANRIKLQQMKEEQDLQRQRVAAQQKAQEREQAWAEAKPFLDVFLASDASDRLANMATQGNVGGFLDNAEGVFKRAGIPFDVSRFRVAAPRTNVDLSGVGMGVQAPPVGAPAEGLTGAPGMTVEDLASLFGPSPAGTTPGMRGGQPVSRAPGTAPGAGTAFDKIMGLAPLSRPGASQVEAPQFVARQAQEPPPPSTPAVEPFNEEEAYRERYRPGVLTQAKLGDYTSKAAERLARQGLWKTQEEKNQATTETMRILAAPRARLALSTAGLNDERAATEALLRDPRLRTEIAKAAALESLPGYRDRMGDIGEERNDIALYGIDTTAATARRGQDMASATAAANRALRGQGPQVPEGSKPFVAKLAALATATQRQASGAERPLTPQEIDAQAAQINAEHQRAFGIPLFGEGGVLSEASVTAGAPAPAPAAAAPARVPLTNAQRQQLIQKLIKQGVPKAEAIRLAGQHSGG